MCSMNQETKSTAAVHSPRNTTVATAVLAKLCTAAQLSSFIRYFLVAEPSEYKMMSVEHF
jgi:hypothetical protein